MIIYKKFSILGYYQKGENPRLLFHSGTHGDEYEVIPLVKETLEKYANKLPDYVYIPEVSPSAVKTKTRRNKNGNDLNRMFLENTKDDEAVANIKFHKNLKFDLCVDFHEDPEFADFYLYDSGQLSTEQLFELRNAIGKIGIGLLTGVDDPGDPTLGFKFTKGYKSFAKHKSNPMGGTFWDWSQINGIAKRIFVAEIPGVIPKVKKRELVGVLFEKLILPLL